MQTSYHEAEIRTAKGKTTRLEVATDGHAVSLVVNQATVKLKPAEAKAVIMGILNALTCQCGLGFDGRNAFCRSLEMHPVNYQTAPPKRTEKRKCKVPLQF
jgi:hypothetical protein